MAVFRVACAASRRTGGCDRRTDRRSRDGRTGRARRPGYDHPNAESDLNFYRARYGLGACTTENGCFRKVYQRGGTITGTTGVPPTNVGWGQEIDLDIEMVSAACPLCKILLVEANSTAAG